MAVPCAVSLGEKLADDGLAGEGRQRDGRDKLLACRRDDYLHLRPALDETADDVAGLIGGNAARNAQDYLLAFQYICHKRFLLVQCKVTVQYPAVVARVTFQHLGYRHAFVLAKVEDFDALIIVNHATGKVNILIEAREVGKEIHVVLQVFRITVELCHQHFIGSSCVGLSRMSILQVLTAIELVGGRKGTLLHLVEDNLHVDKLATTQVDVHLGTEEFFGQQGDIETVGVEASQVATLDVVGYATCHFLEHVGQSATSAS